MQLFDLYLILQMVDKSAIEMMIHAEHEEVTTIDPNLKFVQQVLPDKVATFHGLCHTHNHFQNPNSLVSLHNKTTLHVTV